MTEQTPTPSWHLSDVLNHVQCAVIVRELGTDRIQFWDATAEALFGWSAAEALGQNADGLLNFQPTGSRESTLAVVMATGRWEGIATVTTRTGRVAEVETCWSLMRNAAGEPLAITESIRALGISRQHRDERLFYGSVLNAIDVGVVAVDSAGKLAYVNRQAAIWYPTMTGPEPLESWVTDVGLLKADRVTPWRVEEMPLYRALQGETLRDVEFVSAYPGDELTTRILHAQPIQDAQGVLLGAVVVIHEATAFRQAADRLETRESQVAASEQLGEWGLWELDVVTGQLTWSEALYAIMDRYPPGQAVTMADFVACIHPDDREHVMGVIQSAMAAGHGEFLSFRVLRPSGEVRYIESRALVMRREEGRTLRATGVVKDVTRQREADRLKDEFLSVVSHELRTPLTSLRAAISLIAGGMPVDAKVGEHDTPITLAERGIARLEMLVGDMLDVERLRTGKLTLRQKRQDAADLLTQAVACVQALITKAGLSLRVHSPEDRAAVHVDAGRIQQALTHLLDNAIAFSPPGATLTVGLKFEGGEVHYFVCDQGPGIPPGMHDAIFERFRQVDGSDTRTKQGSGLGLAFARSVVEAHSGRIWVTSEPGSGANFYLALPMADKTG